MRYFQLKMGTVDLDRVCGTSIKDMWTSTEIRVAYKGESTAFICLSYATEESALKDNSMLFEALKDPDYILLKYGIVNISQACGSRIKRWNKSITWLVVKYRRSGGDTYLTYPTEEGALHDQLILFAALQSYRDPKSDHKGEDCKSDHKVEVCSYILLKYGIVHISAACGSSIIRLGDSTCLIVKYSRGEDPCLSYPTEDGALHDQSILFAALQSYQNDQKVEDCDYILLKYGIVDISPACGSYIQRLHKSTLLIVKYSRGEDPCLSYPTEDGALLDQSVLFKALQSYQKDRSIMVKPVTFWME